MTTTKFFYTLADQGAAITRKRTEFERKGIFLDTRRIEIFCQIDALRVKYLKTIK